MIKPFFILIFILAGINVCGQTSPGLVKGTVKDSASALADATVSVVRTSDSTLISFTLSGNNGYFEIKNIIPGNYNLLVSYSGLKTLKKSFTVSDQSPVVDLGIIEMDRHYQSLDEVIIKDDAPIKIKGDTIAYNADAFKTKPNATVEDLLKKLPGVQVERDGTVKAQGEQVQKVYVDGKEFFGNDPKIATKNLTAEMVDQVEVYDDMSEQARFNQIDDGSRSKAINLKLKKDKKKGIFGRAYAGGGTENRYDVGLNANFFKGAMQTALIAKSNNTNNIGFSFSDMMGMFSGGRGMNTMMSGLGGAMMGGMSITRAGSGGGGFGGLNLGNSGSGITSSSQLGFNYRDTWSKTFDVNGSYFYNKLNTVSDRNVFRNTFAPDSALLMDGSTLAKATNDNHRLSLNVIVTIDSFNSLVYSPNFSFQKSSNNSFDSFYTNTRKGEEVFRTNESSTLNTSTGEGFNLNNNLIWRRKFRKPGRTLSANFSNTIAQNQRDAFSVVNARFYNNAGFKWSERNNNTLNSFENETNNYGLNVSYTEPIARDKILEINFQHARNSNQSDRYTKNFDPFTGKYDDVVDSLSNVFDNTNIINRIGTNLRIVKKSYNYQVGVSVQQTNLERNNTLKATQVKQNFTNIFPTAVFNYRFARNRNLRFNYRGSTRQPDISQLQDVTDITRYPYIWRGNPGLGQEFTNNFSLNYSYFDIISFRNLFAYITYSNTIDKISNSITQLPGGVQLSQPVNINGVYFLSGTFNLGFPIKKMKGGNFNTNTRFNLNRDANLLDGVKNYTRNLVIGEDLRLSYNHKEKLDMGIGISVNYNSVSYTVQKQNNQSFFTHNYTADISYSFPFGLIVATDLDFNMNTGRSDGFNQNFTLWNASLAKEVFKSKKGEIKLSVFDLLNQNTNVNRHVGMNYVEDVRTNALQRFFMLTFSYKLNRMGGRTMPAIIERATRNIRIQ